MLKYREEGWFGVCVCIVYVQTRRKGLSVEKEDEQLGMAGGLKRVHYTLKLCRRKEEKEGVRVPVQTRRKSSILYKKDEQLDIIA